MSRRADYIPRSDADFNKWFRNFCDRIIANPAAYGVLPDELAELQAVYAAWQTDYPAHVADQNKARASADTCFNSRPRPTWTGSGVGSTSSAFFWASRRAGWGSGTHSNLASSS